MTKITRVEDRATGDIRYYLDKGGPQLLGPSYATREEAETALAASALGRKGGSQTSEAKRIAAKANAKKRWERATGYRVQYQLSDTPVNRPHRTIKAAVRDLRACQRAAARGGDEQGIIIVRADGVPLTDAEQQTIRELLAE